MLNFLRNAGWLEDRRQYKWMYYQINKKINELEKNLLKILQEHLFPFAQIKKDRKKLEAYLTTKKEQACS